MSIPFIDRDPTQNEFERFRLILSTYQDGSGQQALRDGRTLPGWRDFERSVAVAFGVSCKMRRTLKDTMRTGRVTLELSNSSGKFWQRLSESGIHQQNYKNKPVEVARSLMIQEHEWHEEVGLKQGGVVDLSKSFYLALSWNVQGEYQLFKFALSLPKVSSLKWDFPLAKNNGEERISRRLRGQDKKGTLFEWYGESGGQLKYYPLVENALWNSPIFRLEPLPVDWNEKHGILTKAKDYFPDLWKILE